LVVFVNTIPDLLCEEVEPRVVGVLKGTNVWQTSQGSFYLLLFADLSQTIFTQLWQINIAK